MRVNGTSKGGVSVSAMPLSSPWIMQNINLWDCVTGGASLESYEREEIIYEQGEQMDCVYVVKCGRVRLSSVGCGGNEQIFMFMEQGSMFGETDFYERGLRICRATAICKTTLYRVELDDFRRQLEENLDFCHNLMALWSQKLNLLTGRIESLAFTDTYSRCAQVLLNLMEMYGEKVDGGYRIGVEVTHQNIANLVTSTRVTINKIIRRMVQEGLIDRDSRHYVIRDVEGLRKIVGSQYTGSGL
ncbi:Crp/Fnr family transcriptional regulator [Harryflintia acetispora]|nr:Crp/Fnr family transcriptional regulator [Harryflintia acetispora]